jgi:hypothetical protein
MNTRICALVLGLIVGLSATGTADAVVARNLILKWAPHPQPVIGYEVYYGRAPDAARMRRLPVPVGMNLNSPSVQFNVLRDLRALPGQNVCFRLKAYNSQIRSKFSPAVCTRV